MSSFINLSINHIAVKIELVDNLIKALHQLYNPLY